MNHTGCQLWPNSQFSRRILLLLKHSRLFLLKCFFFHLHHHFFSILLSLYKRVFLNLKKQQQKTSPGHTFRWPLLIFSAPLCGKTIQSIICPFFILSHFILNKPQLGFVSSIPLKLFLYYLYFASSLSPYLVSQKHLTQSVPSSFILFIYFLDRRGRENGEEEQAREFPAGSRLHTQFRALLTTLRL